jgi:nucleoside-diphosphate-sugar epimerase
LRRIGKQDKLVDFTFIDHAVEAHMLAAGKLLLGRDISGKVYFVSDGQPVLLWNFIDKILASAGIAPVQRTISPKVAYAAGLLFEWAYHWLRLKTEPRLTRFLATELSTAHWFDISAARSELGYNATVNTEEGLRRLGRWLQSTGQSIPE